MIVLNVPPKGIVLPCGIVATALISGSAFGGGGGGVGVGDGVGDGVGVGCGLGAGAQLAPMPPSTTYMSTARPILKIPDFNMTYSLLPCCFGKMLPCPPSECQ